MKTSRRIRIGTRESTLALYQARQVKQALISRDIKAELVQITSDGDVDLVTPLYEMGIQGIFTKSLDIALLQNRIDIAVHSAKDVPTKLAKGLVLSAMLERAIPFDCLVLPNRRSEVDLSESHVIATSSLRRRSQWLDRYPRHSTKNIRGNVQTRLAKLDDSEWGGAIFAQAALERLEIRSHKFITLDWMLPSPAQGAIAVACRQDDAEILMICRSISHHATSVCVTAERDFLATLHGGCAVPVGAYATIEKDHLFFQGNLFSLDGKEKVSVQMRFPMGQAVEAGVLAAKEMLAKGADVIINAFRPAS